MHGLVDFLVVMVQLVLMPCLQFVHCAGHRRVITRVTAQLTLGAPGSLGGCLWPSTALPVHSFFLPGVQDLAHSL
jgi:hypothetical protein